ncbi:hypothetical protein Gotri_026301, partial [Gossypium trilobum]|nr:hypothetical protein [Gossypium trilobum]
MTEDKDTIVSFDIANEKFSVLLMLEFVGCYTEDPYRVKLLVFNGSLGAVVYRSTYIAIEPWTAPEKYFHFWVMNGEAWTKQFSIESVPEVSHPLEFWKT